VCRRESRERSSLRPKWEVEPSWLTAALMFRLAVVVGSLAREGARFERCGSIGGLAQAVGAVGDLRVVKDTRTDEAPIAEEVRIAVFWRPPTSGLCSSGTADTVTAPS
jgi:hypothetical protein